MVDSQGWHLGETLDASGRILVSQNEKQRRGELGTL